MKKKGNSATKAKAKYNMKNYDDVCFRVGIGGNAYINYLAKRAGKSKAEYIRSLIISDATRKGETNARIKLGGGGVIVLRNGFPLITAETAQPEAPRQLQLEDKEKISADTEQARAALINYLKNKCNVNPNKVNSKIQALIDSFGQ